MSYCRFGWDDSDVYVYSDVAGGWTCCACQLNTPAPGRIFPPSANLNTPGEMAAHLRKHRDAGHTVPDYAIADLDAEEAAGVRNERVEPT